MPIIASGSRILPGNGFESTRVRDGELDVIFAPVPMALFSAVYYFPLDSRPARRTSVEFGFVSSVSNSLSPARRVLHKFAPPEKCAQKHYLHQLTPMPRIMSHGDPAVLDFAGRVWTSLDEHGRRYRT